jgi:3-deoxy-7-phosphoheptulonate synthase/chorismate mutase
MPDCDLERLRRSIDELNFQLLELLQQRAEAVVEISRLKEALGLEMYDPRREEEMLQQLMRPFSGPFDAAELRTIFQAIFRASRSLQQREKKREDRLAVEPVAAGSEA